MRFAAAVPVLLLLFVSSQAAAPADDAREASRPREEIDRPLLDALTLVEENYLHSMTREEIVARALRAFLADLDPYSKYLDAAEWRLYEADLSSEFGGIGVGIGIDETAQLPRIEHQLIGSAAFAAGVRRGDLILSIEGESLRGLSIDQVRDRLIGRPGTAVALSLQREGTDAPIQLTVERKVVKSPSVRGVRRDAEGRNDFILDRDRKLGYIRIPWFANDTVAAAEAATAELRKAGVEGVVLDLRDSAGGLMKAAIGVADLFLDEGRMFSERSREETLHWDASKGGLTEVPMVVLINGGTVSSSEILAIALQANGRARFVGQRTFGKARTQRKFSLAEGDGGVVLTTGIFHTPAGGAMIDRHDDEKTAGIAPAPGLEFGVEDAEYRAWADHAFLLDGPVILDESESAAPPDRVLDRAVEALMEDIAKARRGGVTDNSSEASRRRGGE